VPLAEVSARGRFSGLGRSGQTLPDKASNAALSRRRTPVWGERARRRFNCRLTPTLSGIAKGEQRQITLSVNDLQISCRTSYSPSVA